MPDHPDHPPTTPGHVVKARYTPTQTTVLGADEQDSPFHPLLREADDLGGMPVVVADLHSALPAIVAGARARRPAVRVVYVMSDGGALPMPFSRTVAALGEAGWLTGTVSTGQAFGGDLEAVTVHSGLLAARLVLHADVAVVAQGPGNLGTGTRWGFSGVSAGEAINAAGTLGGRPVAALRISEADARARHLGLSHHSVTALTRVALHRADLVVPHLEGPLGQRVRSQVAELAGTPRVADLGQEHRVVTIGPGDGQRIDRALEEVPIRLSTMGRGLAEDRAAFRASAAAGWHAAGLLG